MKRLTDKKDILKAIRKPGKVFVYTVLDCAFPIEKQAVLEFALSHDCDLLIDEEDGYKQLEYKM